MIPTRKEKIKIFNKEQENYYTNYLKRKTLNEYIFTTGLFILGPICLLLTLFIRYRLIFMASSDIGGIESNVIYSIQRYMAGFPLYANPETAPFSITQYSPFYYRIIAFGGSLLNLDPDNPLSIYRLSRVISLLANGLYAVLIFKLSNRLYRNSKIGLSVAIIAFVLLPPQTYSRPDSVYILFVILTLYAGLRTVQSDSTATNVRWLSLSVVSAALAIATKQSGIILPFILASYFAFFRKQWSRSMLVFLSCYALALLFLLGLMPEHNLSILYKNIVLGVSQGLDWGSFKINIVDHFFRTFNVQIAFGLPLCIWLMRQSKPSYSLLGWFVLTLFGFSLITSLKSGSALNYFTEYVSLTGIIIALWLRNQLQLVPQVNTTWVVLILSGIVWSVVPNMPNFNWSIAMHADALSEQPYLEQKEIANYVTDSLELKPTEKVFITYHNYCFLNGLLYKNCILPQQEIVAIMYARKELNYAAFDSELKRHSIRILITRTDETTTAFKNLSTNQYRLKRRFPQFDVYESI